MSSEPKHFRVIRPDSRSKQSAFTAIRHLLKEIWVFRSHIWIVFSEQFRGFSYGSGLGVFWNYVLPIVPLSVYLFLARMRVFPNFTDINGAVFLSFGVTLWFLFSGCIQTPINIVQSRNKEVMKTAFPLSAAIVSGFAQLLFDTLMRIVFVAAIVILTKSWPTLQALLLPITLLPAILLFIGAGLFLSILNVIYNDVSRVITIALQYGLFVSGVLFPIGDVDLLAKINAFNPFYIFIEGCRSLVFHGSIANLNAYLEMTILSIVLFIISCRLFFIMEYRVRGIN
jgi:lipopolysaccharide transport system permease protein